MFWREECSWYMRVTTSPSSASCLSRQCGILNISQPYRLPWPVTGITLLYFLLLDKCFEMRPSLQQWRGWPLFVAATFDALKFWNKHICIATASKSLYTLCTLCHCTILSNIYTIYKLQLPLPAAFSSRSKGRITLQSMVGQSVLVLSPIWGSRPNISHCS
jgi:hypothetical protein